MIRTFLLSTVAVTAFAGAALAADLPSRRAPPIFVPPPPIPVFTWTGFYAGVHAGYEFGKSNGVIFNNVNGIPVAAGGSNPGGVVGGGHIGYLYQVPSYFGGGLVFGVEGDVDGSGYGSTYAIGAVNDKTSRTIQGSARGRLGFAVDRALFYATGGAAFGDIKNTYFSALGTDSISHTRIGYTVGGGVEYSLTNNVSVRVEYRYTDFGKYTDRLVASTPNGIGSARHNDTDNRVQAGISYRFGGFGGSPVVARY